MAKSFRDRLRAKMKRAGEELSFLERRKVGGPHTHSFKQKRKHSARKAQRRESQQLLETEPY